MTVTTKPTNQAVTIGREQQKLVYATQTFDRHRSVIQYASLITILLASAVVFAKSEDFRAAILKALTTGALDNQPKTELPVSSFYVLPTIQSEPISSPVTAPTALVLKADSGAVVGMRLPPTPTLTPAAIESSPTPTRTRTPVPRATSTKAPMPKATIIPKDSVLALDQSATTANVLQPHSVTRVSFEGQGWVFVQNPGAITDPVVRCVSGCTSATDFMATFFSPQKINAIVTAGDLSGGFNLGVNKKDGSRRTGGSIGERNSVGKWPLRLTRTTGQGSMTVEISLGGETRSVGRCITYQDGIIPQWTGCEGDRFWDTVPPGLKSDLK